MNIKRSLITLLIVVGIFFSYKAQALYIDTENPFFSYQRFYAQLDVLSAAYHSKGVRGDIKSFLRNFAAGIQAISADQPEKAKERLLKALTIWPEYFGTDFLLARVNEDTGNYRLAARFYKSYLNKLKSYSEGHYRVTGPLMKGITPYRIENYDDAYVAVRDRLKTHGIELDAVQPYYTPPGHLRFLVILVILAAAYVIMVYVVIPQVKRMHHMNNPPEGSWVCKKCETYNLNIWKECEKCGEKRPDMDDMGTVHLVPPHK